MEPQKRAQLTHSKFSHNHFPINHLLFLIFSIGACEGTLACSTCHLIFEQKHFDMLPKPSDEELDMLDLAYGLTET